MTDSNLFTQSHTKKHRRFFIPMNRTNLKLYGCVTMLFYTIGVSVFQNGLLHYDQFQTGELALALKTNSDLMVLAGWASIFQLIGGLSIPVYAFLLVEGFIHTSNPRHYLMRMLLFAVLSEIPYDLAMSGTIWDPSSQNVLFTLAVAFVMLYGLRYLSMGKSVWIPILQIAVILAALFWCRVLQCNFALCMILLAAVYYLAYEQNGIRILIGCAVSILYVTAPLSGYVLWNYTGEQGRYINKYVFYLFYPLHLLLLGLTAHLLK